MWSALSPRQRRVLIGLGAANAIMLIVAGTLALSPLGEPPAPAPPEASPTCRFAAARALSQRDVPGSITIGADGSIEFVLSGSETTDAWAALAVSAELPALGCGPYDPIRVDVPDPSLAPDLRLVVEARWVDVQAWSHGRIPDETLSQRTLRSTYQRP